MGDSESAVFLEDVTPSSSQATKRYASGSPAAPSQAKSKAVDKPARMAQSQATLTTFFSSSGSKTAFQGGVKRLKTESGAAAVSTPIQSGSQQLPKLNSIPFSLSAFQSSLTEEQKDLLLLECESIGLSW